MIKCVIGDATSPKGEGNKIIVHICNDKGAWGAGFVLALSKKWKQPEKMYRSMSKADRVLGTVQLVPVEKDVFVVNMIGQHDVKPTKVNGLLVQPIRYDAVLECLRRVNGFAKTLNASVHMPRIGCGLAGGKWETVEVIVNEALKDIEVTVYDLK